MPTNDNGVVLLIEDNAKLNDLNKRALKMRGYTVLTAENLSQAREILSENAPDVILLDVMLPDGDGFDFCEEIRGKTSAHILFLTAKTEHVDRVRGLTGGGDDYITKPFHPEELLARVGAAMRRRNIDSGTSVIVKGALTLDVVAARACVDGADLSLAPKEFSLLLLLARNEGVTVGADELYEKIWNMPLGGDKNAMWATISKLRKKLSESGFTITAERGEGYCFERI